MATSSTIVTPGVDRVADPGRLIVHDGEMHLEWYADAFVVGDTVDVIRGNGPREGDHMGLATVTGFEDGSPVLFVTLDWVAGA